MNLLGRSLIISALLMMFAINIALAQTAANLPYSHGFENAMDNINVKVETISPASLPYSKF
ncbi:MAG: hypothetical protein FWC26_14475 [Fibromonadales bacterium]|nr:hypothetical protein [Fibromonadales bacterium]